MDKLRTKADILQGTKRKERIYVEALDGEVTIRPLNSGEFQQVEILKTVAGLTVKGKPQDRDFEAEGLEINLEQMQMNDFEGDCLAVSLGLVDEKWTTDEVKQMPVGAVKEIAQAIYDLGGVTPAGAEKIRSFRTEQGRKGNLGTK